MRIYYFFVHLIKIKEFNFTSYHNKALCRRKEIPVLPPRWEFFYLERDIVPFAFMSLGWQNKTKVLI